MEAPQSALRSSFEEAFKDFYLGHFQQYNQARGNETAIATLTHVQNLQLFEAFDGMVSKLAQIQNTQETQQPSKPVAPSTHQRFMDERVDRLVQRFRGAVKEFWHPKRNALVLVTSAKMHPKIQWKLGGQAHPHHRAGRAGYRRSHGAKRPNDSGEDRGVREEVPE